MVYFPAFTSSSYLAEASQLAVKAPLSASIRRILLLATSVTIMAKSQDEITCEVFVRGFGLVPEGE